ncbi:HlyD family type I secretion periplasmic adaptor subunit [Paracraurococcus ruber]|uniref:Membrane fusion protein (MFP) family protein n=1 Tax=Paracraurococcus ruber TaxID=77675 RepID=A0ABS1D2L5_9PROT|nr:HlyD family type I secretion periplasmic adaptor subunit [Paracraurococcus ruber]MBK1661034.1 hypothetical protein [Paracraurococcus ruber]TDG23520.1 HlyD family type I secretion periplasmic adaptor subunit [Paracraurococcus ruber]
MSNLLARLRARAEAAREELPTAPPRRLLRRRLRGPAPARLAPEAIGFQDELEALLAEPAPRLLGGVFWLVAGLFAALLVLAALARLDVVVTGSGRLAPDAPPIVLQPMERGVIREIRVKPGDIVRRGQVLAVLDPSFAEADRAALAAQRATLAAQLARLEAELDGRVLPPGGADLEALLQAALQARRQAILAARLRGLEEEIRGQETAIRTLEATDAVLAEQAAIARDVEEMRGRLMQGQVGSRLSFLGARADRLRAERERDQGRGRTAELRHVLEAKRAERAGLLEDWRRQILEEAVRTRSELARVEEALGKASRLAELTLVTAPEDGTVLEVARRSVGSVLREAEPLVSLVPAAAPLIAEIALRSADIGHVRAGDAVVLKVDAFPWQRHGAVQGRLRAVAPDSLAPEGQAGAVHRAQVALDAPALRHLPEGSRLIPGMTLTAEIKAGERSLLSYLLFPILRGLQESLREP